MPALALLVAAIPLSGCMTARPYLEHEDLAATLAPPPPLVPSPPVPSAPVPERAPAQATSGTNPGPVSSTASIVRSLQAGAQTDPRPDPITAPATNVADNKDSGAAPATGPNSDPKVARTEAEATAPTARPGTAMAPVVPPPAGLYPIDLPTALRLAESINPVIGEARARIGEALGQQQTARSLLLPTLNAGVNYHGHTGVFQRSTGQILSVSNQSLNVGSGTRAMASGTAEIPGVNLLTPLAEALYEPLVARQRVDASRFDASATANTVLLGVALDYFELHGAMAALEARGQTESEAAEVARITRAYALTGEGRQADADRANTEWKLRRADVRAAEERLAVASARLVRRLHLDQAIRINPTGDPLELFSLVDPDTPTENLLATALRQRPEIHARSADVGAAEQRLQKERARPFLPTVWVGFSGSGFGGGSNLVPPLIGMFRGRTDFDVQLFWTLLNFGMGNLSLQKQQQTRVGQADATRARVINQVREEVVAARADVLAWRERIELAMRELEMAHEGFLKDLDRVRGAAAPPLEALDNLRLLRQARESFIAAVVAYNQAQFRLFVAMGAPPPLVSPTEPAPPASTAATLVAASVPAPAPPPTAPATRPVVAEPSTVRPTTLIPPAPITVQASPTTPPASRESKIPITVAVPQAPEPSQPAVRPTTARAPASGPAPAPDPGPVREGLSSLSRARQDALKAMSDYDREQARLMELLEKEGPNLSRDEWLRRLNSLARAHHDEMETRVEYDRALWRLFSTLGKEPAPPEVSRSPEAPSALK